MKDYAYVTQDGGFEQHIIWRGNYKQGEGSSVYSDRMYEWDAEKFNRCAKEAFGNTGQYFYSRRPEDIEKFLSLYFEKDVELTAIEQHTNVSSGFPYWQFCYKERTLERNDIEDLCNNKAKTLEEWKGELPIESFENSNEMER